MANIDYTGVKFNRLTIIGNAKSSGGMRKVFAKCICGKESLFFLKNLKKGHTKSCGCLHTEVITKHGNSPRITRSREYNSWACMRARCNNKNDLAFPNYGGRGIAVCPEWENDFVAFLRDMGARPTGTSLDRIDVNGNYEPSNCRWATKKMQVNNMRKNVFIEHDGKRMTMSEWAERLGISFKRIAYRVEHGWPANMILSPHKYDRNKGIVK